MIDILTYSDFIKDDGAFQKLKEDLSSVDDSISKVMSSAELFAKVLDIDVRKGGKVFKESKAIVE